MKTYPAVLWLNQ